MSIYVNNPLTFHSSKNFEKNPSPRFLSAEIEVAVANSGISVMDALCDWSASSVADGSLSYGGFEINTSPAQGDAFIEQIDDIGEALARQDARVDNSCGLHVHVDARDFTYQKMKNYAYVWASVENIMFDLIARNRRSSTYCAPLGNKLINHFSDQNQGHGQTVKQLIEGIYGSPVTASSMLNARRPSCRYHAINLHSWIYRGTIENRMHHGTVNPEKIKNWAMLNSIIIDCAAQIGSREAKELPTKLNSAEYQLGFLVSIAPSLKNWIIDRYRMFAMGMHGNSPVEATER